MNIVYIIDSLAQKGGAERIVSEKMSYLADHEGYDVTVITCYQLYNIPNTYPLSNKVRQINLAIAAFRQYRHKYPIRLWTKRKYKKQLSRRLNETTTKLQPDIIIGMSYLLGDVVCNIKTKAPIIIEAHEAKDYTGSSLFYGATSIWKKIYLNIHRYFYLHTIEKKANVVVTLTQKDAKKWSKAQKVITIPNFSSMSITKISDVTQKKAIAVGRLEWQKSYDRMIEIWKIVTQKHPDWQLNIYGDGVLKSELCEKIEQLSLENVKILPFTTDISQRYAESSLCLLTSYFEGFSLVLLEAQRHGLPCITFDCPYGPSEIIDDGKTGYVIDNNNKLKFAEKICYLIEHPGLRAEFSAAALNKATYFNKVNIMKQWKLLFASLAKNNNILQ